MTRLLVSVRDADEAMDAVAAGVDLIDLKEPRNGPLGAVDFDTMATAGDRVAGRRPMSVALGELADFDFEHPRRPPPGIDYFKLGLAGQSENPTWRRSLATAVEALSGPARGVAVVYADWRAAVAPAPEDVLRAARDLRLGAVLVDTWNKSAGGLLDLWLLDEVATIVAAIQETSALAVIAGGLTANAIVRILPLAPDYVAVRSAVCLESREGRLSFELAEQLARVVHAGSY